MLYIFDCLDLDEVEYGFEDEYELDLEMIDKFLIFDIVLEYVDFINKLIM